MPITPTYPGVYVQEIPSGVRTITGVATSITAFVGRTQRGPVDEPVTINSFADFERTFGGLWEHSPLSFAVHDFYMNGGNQAIIVRLFKAPVDETAKATIEAKTKAEAADAKVVKAEIALTKAEAKAKTAKDTVDKAEPGAAKTIAETEAKAANAKVAQAKIALTEAKDEAKTAHEAFQKLPRLELYAKCPVKSKSNGDEVLMLKAVSPGKWGDSLRVSIEHLDDTDFDKQRAKGLGLKPEQMFHLTVYDGQTEATESHRYLTKVKAHTRFMDKMLENNSTLVRGHWDGTDDSPLPEAHAAADGGDDIWADDTEKNTSSGFSDGKDGKSLDLEAFTGEGMEMAKKGLYALEHADLFNLLCIPPHSNEKDIESDLLTAASAYAKKRRAFMIIDPPAGWTDKANAKEGMAELTTSENTAVYFPRLRKPNPLRGGQIEDFAPCGAVAGVMARTDSERGVWKAPAGLEATLNGVPQLSVALTDAENGELNPLGINCLRSIPAAGRVIWGARTMQGNDRLASEWKYVSVRRLALHIEESLYRGTQWVVFEPNDEPLWAQIRLNLGTFMHDLFRKGAFQGTSPKEAYFVKCDHETTTQSDINLGVVNILVGFAPLKPAEFVIISLQQMAGQLQA